MHALALVVDGFDLGMGDLYQYLLQVYDYDSVISVPKGLGLMGIYYKYK